MSTWEGAKRAQNSQLKMVLGLFLVTCMLFGWRYVLSARSAPQIVERAPLSRPRVVMFDISHELQRDANNQADPIPLANAALYRGLTQEKRWELMSLQARDALLDPAWTTAPTTLEEALELGRETGADWAIQGKLKQGDDFYRISFKLIALTPKQWRPEPEDLLSPESSQNASLETTDTIPDDSVFLEASSPTTATPEGADQGVDSGGENGVKPQVETPSAETPSAEIPPAEQQKTRSPLPPQIIDFNTLNTSELLLAEHIVWVTRSTSLDEQLERVGRLILAKAQFKLEQKRQKFLEAQKLTEEAPKKKRKPKLSKRERRAQALNEAAQRELDDIQARIDAEYKQREENERLKREVLAQEASKAWAELEQVSGGAGLLTVRVEIIKESLKHKMRRERRGQSYKPQQVIKPALITWTQVKRVTANLTGISVNEHKDKLLSFIHKYKGIPKYQPHVEEARNRYTWINRSQVQWARIYGHEFPVGSLFPVRDEQPVSWVKVGDFEASVSEVSNAQYKRCVDAKVCTPPHWDDKRCEVLGDHRSQKMSLPAQMRRGDMPVVCIDWNQANRYAKWVGGRLLSESEWEFAARSGDKFYIYPWGRETASCSIAVMNNGDKHGCGFESALPVCSKVRGNSNSGLCDLAGNVWEWVADTYFPSYAGIPKDGSPTGGGGKKVLRGGSFAGDYRELYSSTRGQLDKLGAMNVVGFRVARAITLEP